MTTRTDLTGLTEVGSTAQTIALADVLDTLPSARQTLRGLLDLLDRPITYSNEDGDRRQRVAAVLADLMRKYDGPKIY